jgi:hypothetical protein
MTEKEGPLFRASADLVGCASRFHEALQNFHNAVRYENFHRLEGLLSAFRDEQENLVLALDEFERVLREMGLAPPAPCNRFDAPQLPPICRRRGCPSVGIEESPGHPGEYYCARHWREATTEGQP